LDAKIKVAAVSYLNTKPLLYGIEKDETLAGQMELLLDYPSNLAKSLQQGTIDMALMPVAAMPFVEGARIVSDYGIASDGNVASVCIFSQVPIERVESVYLDYQSRSSVRLAKLLLEKYWNKNVILRPAPENYIEYINDTTAGVIIGDRALQQRVNFEYVYDLAEAWEKLTGYPFIFAAWIANKDLPADFLEAFNKANAVGLDHIDEIVAAHPFPYYDLKTYYTENIKYELTPERKKGLEQFLEMIAE